MLFFEDKLEKLPEKKIMEIKQTAFRYLNEDKE